MLKRSLLLPAAAMLVALLAVFLGTARWEHEANDGRDMANRLVTVRTLFSLYLHNEVGALQGLLGATARDESLATSFEHRDRARLLSEAHPLFEALRTHHRVTHLYFLEPDGTVLLRVHRPEQFGDRDHLHVVQQAMATGLPAAGLEVGASKILTLRVVMPWVVEERRIGFIEVGVSAFWVLDQIKIATGAELSLLLPQDTPLANGFQGDWPLLGDRRVFAATAAIPGPIAEALVAGRLRGAHDGELTVDGRDLHAAITPVSDVSGRALGEVLVISDVSARHGYARRTLLIVGVVGLLVSAGLMLLFMRVVRRVDEEVTQTEDGLRKRLRQRAAAHDMDIAGRRVAEEQLALLVRAVEQGPASVMITDTSGTIEYVNPRFTEVTGYTAGEVLGRNPRILRSGTKAPEEYQTLWKTLRAGQDWHGEFVNLRKDGTAVLEKAVISPVRAADGTIHHFIAVKEDITAQRQAEERLDRLQDELAHVDRLSLLGEMAAMLAHEVKQPLGAIVNYAGGCIQRIRTGKGDPESLLFALEKITEQGKHAGEVIKKIRALVTKAKPDTEPVDVNELVEQAASLLRNDARRDEVYIDLQLSTALPRAEADPIQIQQVLINLLQNAVQACASVDSSRRCVTVQTGCEDDMVTITVTDRGPGVAEAALSDLFKPFYTTKPGGMGMGLAVCRSIVEAHGGRIEARNNAHGGLTLEVWLPKTSEEQRHVA